MTDQRSLATRVARGFLFSGVGHLLSRGVFLAALLVVLRRISPDQFGVASIVLAVFAITEALNEMGLGVALIQRQDIQRAEIHALFWVSAALSAALYAVVVLAAPLAAAFYDEPGLTALLRVYGLSLLFFPLIFVPRSLLMKELSFGRIAFADTFSLAAGSGVMLALGFLGHGPWAILLGDLTHRLGQLILCNAFRPYLPGWTAIPFRRIGDMVRFGLFVTGSRLLYNFYIHADYLIVGRVFGLEALGIYTLAYRLVSDPVKTLSTIVNQVAYPAFSALQNDLGRLERYFSTIARLALVVIGSLLIVVVLFVDRLLAAGGYHPYLAAVPLVRALALVGLIRGVTPLIPQLLNACGQAGRNFQYSLLAALLMPPAFLLGARFGLIGVALSWSVAYPAVVLLLAWFGARALRLPLPAFVLRLFAGLPRLLPAVLVAVLLRFSAGRLLPADSLPVVAVLAAAALAAGAVGAWRFERQTITTVLAGRREERT